MKKYLSIIAIAFVLISSTFSNTAYGAEVQDLPDSGNTVYEIQANSEDGVVKPEQSSDGWLKSHIRGFREHMRGHLQWNGSIFRYVANILVLTAEAGIGAVAIAGSVAAIGSTITAVLSAVGAIIAGIVILIKKPKSQVA